MSNSILIVDDDRDTCEMLEADLKQRGLEPTWRTCSIEALALIKAQDFDVVLTDLHIPQMSGLELCEQVVAHRPDIPVIVFTGFGSMETAVSAIRAGAYDFVAKPLDLDILSLVIKRALDHRKLVDSVKRLTATIVESKRQTSLLGESPVMQKLSALLVRIGNSDASVLIQGESGTGKEVIARCLHQQGARSKGPFIPINCAALPEALLESELFGHVRGAFTDAKSDRKGLFVEAQGGTLFLDEIGDMPINLQPKLLRALEERKVRPIGSNKDIEFDVRIVAATNSTLETSIVDGGFREDLYYRLNVIPIVVPPLRVRGTDILLLAASFITQLSQHAGKAIKGLSNAAAQKLLDYQWPGNVRELRNAMEHAVVLTEYNEISVEDLPAKIRNDQVSQLTNGLFDPIHLLPLEAVEQRYILHVLKAVDGNRTIAARILNLDRKTLYRKLQSYGL